MTRKLLVLLAAATGGLLVSRKLAARRAEQELWQEATDPVGGR